MKHRLSLAIAFALASAAPSVAHAEWKTRESLDPMTDRKVYSASIESSRGEMVISLVCTMGKKKPEASIIMNVSGVLDWRSLGRARRVRIDFRFDSEKAISRLGEVVDGGTAWVMLDSSLSKNEPRAFVKSLAAHSKLTARPPMYRDGLLDTFDLAGFPTDLFPKGCFS